jgi:endonuclease YncB( thermonuclease family)
MAPTPDNTPVISNITPTATRTPTPIPDEVQGLVVDVIDGNTIAVVMQGDPFQKSYIIRYLGIEAPPRTLNNPWGVVAYETNRDLTLLKVVRLVRDQTEFDEDGNLLRYVYVGKTQLNVLLAERGLAKAAINEPDVALRPEILAAELSARGNNLGLWGPSPTSTPIRFKPANSNPVTNTVANTVTNKEGISQSSSIPSLNLPTTTPKPTITITVTLEP